MSTDRLTPPPSTPEEAAIWRILAGEDLQTTAKSFHLDPADLAAAISIYQQAGRDALAASRGGHWQQVYIRFDDWDRADHTAAARLLPILTDAEQHGVLINWWFIRKHPDWRLRLLPGEGHDAVVALSNALDGLTAVGHFDAWWPGRYEAETAAFGGARAMDAAHRLFGADSRGVLELATQPATELGRRELSLLLCGALMRNGAQLEWYERGDVWDRVAAERPLPPNVPIEKIATMAETIKTLLVADTAPDGLLFGEGGPASAQASWATAFRDIGRDLADANHAGHLKRGLRETLSYHVIFHWNRLGLEARTQAIIAHAARHAILGPSVQPAYGHKHRYPAPTASKPAKPDLDRAIRRFPLIHSGRQHCGSLPDRVALVEEHATDAAGYDNPEKRLNSAAAAWNLAALIAADCDLPDLAEELSFAQFDVFYQAWPLSGRPAIASLQPLVNLARLAQRTGDPKRAYDILAQLERAVLTGGDIQIAGRTIPFSTFIFPDGDRAPVETWLRRTLREDGTRALVAAGDWAMAADHAARYDDKPELLHEARQAGVIAAVHAGRHDEALRLIDTATTTYAWHDAIASCLRVYVENITGANAPDTVEVLIRNVQAARSAAKDPVLTMFRIRLGLAAAHLVSATHPREAELMRAEAAEDAERSGSATAAHEVLDDAQTRSAAEPGNATGLNRLTTSAGLRAAVIPDDLLVRLHIAIQQAASILTCALRQG